MQPSATAEPEKVRLTEQSEQTAVNRRRVAPCETTGIPPQSYPHQITKPHKGDKPPDFARHILNKYYTRKTTEIL